MADEQFTGTGITAPKSLGWEPSPELQTLNKEIEAKHIQEYAPVVQAVAKAASPTATGTDRIAATEQLKNVKSSDEMRWGDLLGAKDFGDIYKAITGGSDQRVEAYDESGNRYFKVFNQRTSAANPYGEFRRYETPDGQPLSPEQQKAAGTITSLAEVPMSQRPFYAANQIAAKDVMTAQASNWNKMTKAAASAALGAPALRDLAVEDKEITKQLLPNSINPHTRTLLAGANEIRTGNTQEIRSNAERLSRFSKGDGSNKDWADFQKTSGGFSIGLNYQEGKGVTNSKGEKVNTEDVAQMANNAMSAASSTSAVTSRQDALLAKAQMLAAEGKIQNFDLIQRYINNQAKKALIIGEIEANGGIGIAKPNLDFSQGDSFVLAHTKAELDEMYADLAEKFSQKVGKAQESYGQTVPGIGVVERMIAQDPTIKERKAITKSNINRFLTENAATFEKINEGKVSSELLQQPGSSRVGTAPSPEMPVARNTPIARPVPAAPIAPARRSLAEIYQNR